MTGFLTLQTQDQRREKSIVLDAIHLRFSVTTLQDIIAIRDALDVFEATGNSVDLQDAIDFFYVRMTSFTRNSAYFQTEIGQTVQANLLDLMAELDAFLLALPMPPESNYTDLIEKSHTALDSVVAYYDEFRFSHDANYAEREALLRQAISFTLILTIFFSLLAGFALKLWRREVKARKGQRTAETRIQELAYQDALTGLANRLSFMESAKAVFEHSPAPVLFLIDLDAFKTVNDTLGHRAGDIMLIEVAKRLNSIFAARDGFVARIGGDEFAGILPEMESAQGLSSFGDVISRECSHSFTAEGFELLPRLSIGIAQHMPEDATPDEAIKELLRQADLALYKCKSDDNMTFSIYDATLAEAREREQDLLAQLPSALSNGEFHVVYQPQIDLETRRIHGCEALLRWTHDGKLIPPDEFIPIAEKSGYITEIDLFVLTQALKEAQKWQGRSCQDIRVSTNLSTRNFTDKNIVLRIRDILKEAQFPPHLVTLEVTETMLIGDWRKTYEILESISDLGVEIALDDFGTGYSSLSYLRKLKVQEVKVDRSFVVDIQDSMKTQIMLDAIIDIVTGLKMRLIVEGIETAEQEETIFAMGARIGQGYFYHKPLAPADLLSVLDAEAPLKTKVRA